MPLASILNASESCAPGTSIVVNSPSLYMNAWKLPEPGARQTLSVQYRPTTSPRSLIPSTFVNVDPGGSIVVNAPFWSLNPWRIAGAAGRTYQPAIAPLSLTDAATVKLDPGKSSVVY